MFDSKVGENLFLFHYLNAFGKAVEITDTFCESINCLIDQGKFQELEIFNKLQFRCNVKIILSEESFWDKMFPKFSKYFIRSDPYQVKILLNLMAFILSNEKIYLSISTHKDEFLQPIFNLLKSSVSCLRRNSIEFMRKINSAPIVSNEKFLVFNEIISAFGKFITSSQVIRSDDECRSDSIQCMLNLIKKQKTSSFKERISSSVLSIIFDYLNIPNNEEHLIAIIGLVDFLEISSLSEKHLNCLKSILKDKKLSAKLTGILFSKLSPLKPGSIRSNSKVITDLILSDYLSTLKSTPLAKLEEKTCLAIVLSSFAASIISSSKERTLFIDKAIIYLEMKSNDPFWLKSDLMKNSQDYVWSSFIILVNILNGMDYKDVINKKILSYISLIPFSHHVMAIKTLYGVFSLNDDNDFYLTIQTNVSAEIKLILTEKNLNILNQETNRTRLRTKYETFLLKTKSILLKDKEKKIPQIKCILHWMLCATNELIDFPAFISSQKFLQDLKLTSTDLPVVQEFLQSTIFSDPYGSLSISEIRFLHYIVNLMPEEVGKNLLNVFFDHLTNEEITSINTLDIKILLADDGRLAEQKFLEIFQKFSPDWCNEEPRLSLSENLTRSVDLNTSAKKILEIVKDQITKEQFKELENKLANEKEKRDHLIKVESKVIKQIEIVHSFFLRYDFSTKSRHILIKSLRRRHFEIMHRSLANLLTAPHALLFFREFGKNLLDIFFNDVESIKDAYISTIVLMSPPSRLLLANTNTKHSSIHHTIDCNKDLLITAKRGISEIFNVFFTISQKLLTIVDKISSNVDQVSLWIILNFSYSFPSLSDYLKKSDWFMKSIISPEICAEKETYLARIREMRHQFETKGVITSDTNSPYKSSNEEKINFATVQRLFAYIQSLVSKTTSLLNKDEFSDILSLIPVEEIFSLSLNLIEMCYEKISTIESEENMERDLSVEGEENEDTPAVLEEKGDLIQISDSAVDIINNLTEVISRQLREHDDTFEINQILPSLLSGLISDSHVVRNVTLKILVSMSDNIRKTFNSTDNSNQCLNTFGEILKGEVSFKNTEKNDPNDDKAKKNKNQKKKDAQARLLSISCGQYSTSAPTYGPDLYSLPSKWPKIPLQTEIQLRLWILRFDLDPSIAELADELWGKLGYQDQVEVSCGNKNFTYKEPSKTDPLGKLLLNKMELIKRIILVSTFFPDSIQEATQKSVSVLLNQISPAEIDHTLNFIINLYRYLLSREPPIVDGFNRELHPASPDLWKPRVRASAFFAVLGSINPAKNTYSINSDVDEEASEASLTAQDYWLVNMFQFFVPEGLSDRNFHVSSQILSSAISSCDKYGLNHMEELLKILENFLTKAPKVPELDKVRQSIIIIIGHLSKHLKQNDPRLIEIFKRLIIGLSFPSTSVQKAIETCISSIIKLLPEATVKETIENIFKTLFSNVPYAERHGAAHGLAGIIKGMGILSLKNFSIVPRLIETLEDKSVNTKNKESALIAIEKLTLSLGRLFEPYIIKVIEILLKCFANSQENVRSAAEKTGRAIMSKLSAHGVKLILPSLLKGLDDSVNWRIKVESAKLISMLSLCGPKQLSSSLPQIIPRLLTLLSDSQGNVKDAGREALEEIARVIRNPEIKTLLPLILVALKDPVSDKGPILKSLSDTCFVHVIDSASLAVIMPIIKRSLEDRSTAVRKDAAKIFGNFFSLAKKEDLQPYVEEVIPYLKNCLLDPVPEVRSVISRALGSMVRGIGESSFNDLMPWLMSTLTSNESPVNRSGAAQGLAEVLGGMGISRLNNIMPDLLKTVNSSDIAPHVKDGCVMLFVYLPVVFKDDFAVFIQDIIPVILKCLADETEFLRQTALKAGQKIVNLFAEKSVNILLPQLENGLFDANWRIRYSSIQLLGDLLYKISGTSQNQEEKPDNLTIEKRIIASLGQECRDEIFSKLQVLRSDPIITVRQSAIHVWKIVVNNTVQMLKQIMPTLIRIILNNLSSDNADMNSISARSLGDILKIGERVLTDILPMMKNSLNSENPQRRKAVAASLHEVLKNISKDQIVSFSSQFIEPIKVILLDPDSSDVRALGAKSLTLLMHSIGINMTDEIFTELLEKLLISEYESIVMDSLKYILTINSRATLPFILPKLIKPSLNAKAFASLSIVSGKSLGKYVDKILPSLVETIFKSIENEELDQLEHCAVILTSIEDRVGVRFILNDLCTALVTSTFSATSTLKSFNNQTAIPQLAVGTIEFRLCCLMLLATYLDKTKTLTETNPTATLTTTKKTSLITEKKDEKNKKKSDESDYESDNSDTDDDDDEISDSGEEEDDHDDDDDDEDDYSERNSEQFNDTYDDDEVDDEDDENEDDLSSSIYQVLSEIYPTLICNMCRLFSYQDDRILKYTWIGIEAIIYRLEATEVTSQINDLRQGIRTALSMLKPTYELADDFLHSVSGEMILPGFKCYPSSHQKLLLLFSDCLVESNSDLKESAALALTETIQVSSPEILKKSVLKIIGPMIRILGERESDTIRAAIINSLTLLIAKTKESIKIFNTQLQAIYIKALGDDVRYIRLLSAKGLACIAPYTNKLGSVIMEIFSNLKKKIESDDRGLPGYTKYIGSSIHALRLILENCRTHKNVKITQDEVSNILLACTQTIEAYFASKTLRNIKYNPRLMNMDIQQNFIQTSLPSSIPTPFHIGASHLAYSSPEERFSTVDAIASSEDDEMILPILASIFSIACAYKSASSNDQELINLLEYLFKIEGNVKDNLGVLTLQTNALIVLLNLFGKRFLLSLSQNSYKILESIFNCIKNSLDEELNLLQQNGLRLISAFNKVILTLTLEEKEQFESKTSMKAVDLISKLISFWKKPSKSDRNNCRYNLMCSVANFAYHLRLTNKAFSSFDNSVSSQVWTVSDVEVIMNPIIIPTVDYLLLGVKDKASQIRAVSEFGIAYIFRLCIPGSQGENSVQAKIIPLLPTSHRTSIQGYLNIKKGQIENLWSITSYFPNGTINTLLEFDFTYLK